MTRPELFAHGLACFLFCCSPLFTRAQEAAPPIGRQERRAARLAETDSYFVAELLGSYHQVQDLATSNHIYRGWGGGLGTGSWRVRGRRFNEFRARGGYHRLLSGAGTLTHDIWTNFSYAYLIQLDRPGSRRFALGGQADILSQVRVTPALVNSQLHWEVVGSLGLVARWQGRIDLPLIEAALPVFAQAHLPLIGYVNRPELAITVADEYKHEISTVGRLRRLDVEVGALFPVRKGNPNLFRVSYHWDLFRWKDGGTDHVIAGRHYLTFGILAKMIGEAAPMQRLNF